MPIVFVRSASVAFNNTFTLDIGSAGENRLICIAHATKIESNPFATSVTVDGKSATLTAQTTNGQSNSQMKLEGWSIGEATLGSSSGVVTINVVGVTSAAAGCIAALYTGVDSATMYDSNSGISGSPNTTISIASMDVPVQGMVIHFSSYNKNTLQTLDTITSPLTAAIANVEYNGGHIYLSYGVETTAQTNKTYAATFSSGIDLNAVVSSWSAAAVQTRTHQMML